MRRPPVVPPGVVGELGEQVGGAPGVVVRVGAQVAPDVVPQHLPDPAVLPADDAEAVEEFTEEVQGEPPLRDRLRSARRGEGVVVIEPGQGVDGEQVVDVSHRPRAAEEIGLRLVPSAPRRPRPSVHLAETAHEFLAQFLGVRTAGLEPYPQSWRFVHEEEGAGRAVGDQVAGRVRDGAVGPVPSGRSRREVDLDPAVLRPVVAQRGQPGGQEGAARGLVFGARGIDRYRSPRKAANVLEAVGQQSFDVQHRAHLLVISAVLLGFP
ncbi:hypothetical protein P3T27_007743 [Kitasatospora sp. MAA19]|nr:hypothetical protein [Kitasatospora sp. MAA19]